MIPLVISWSYQEIFSTYIIQKYENIQSLDVYLKRLHEQVTTKQNDFAPIIDMNEGELKNF